MQFIGRHSKQISSETKILAAGRMYRGKLNTDGQPLETEGCRPEHLEKEEAMWRIRAKQFIDDHDKRRGRILGAEERWTVGGAAASGEPTC